MRGWSELAPYNFIQALRLEEPPDLERWRSAAAQQLRALGEIADVAIETPMAGIDAHLEAELNRGFAAGDPSLRFFVIEVAAGGHWFGVVIDHWWADDFSIRALLERIYASYRNNHSLAAKADLQWARRLPPRQNWLRECRHFVAQLIALRRARRISLRDPLDFGVGCFRVECPPQTLEVVRACAQRARATVHDVFLAAAAQTCALVFPAGARRDAIGLVSAMDLRRFEKGDARSGLGLLISQYGVVEAKPEEASLDELVARISRQTHRMKQLSGRAVDLSGLFFWRVSRSPHTRATVFQRGSPFAAGLSNVNLSGSWLETADIAEFRRVGPTGPVIPLLFMLSTFRGRIFIDATYRTTALDRSRALTMVEDFAQRLARAGTKDAK